jgi:oxygen-dependent protoporphyrinogen oxidase
MHDPDCVIIGAGISGLTVGYLLKKAGKKVLVFEEASRPGGKIGSERIDGYLLESGPNSLRIENQETLDLIEDLGLTSRMIEANPAAKKRYILKNGKWVKVPSSPIEAITTPLFSARAKLRILCEPFSSKTKAEDESVASFITRRLGKGVFDYAADPFITGIYAGDPEKLSMRHAFPAMWRAEQEYGSLIKGAIKSTKRPANENRPKSKIVSFPNGLSELIDVLKKSLGDSLLLEKGTKVTARTEGDYSVISQLGENNVSNVVLALPAYGVPNVIESSEIIQALAGIDYPPVTVAYLGYREDQFPTVPEGFGGLIPSSENRKILGVIFSSSNFPDRAPAGHVLLTVLMGGARNRHIAEMQEEEIVDMAISEIHDLFQTKGKPVFRGAKRWKHAIPQYNVGYSSVLEVIERTEQTMPGLHFLGNYRSGISVGACIRNATELARRLV